MQPTVVEIGFPVIVTENPCKTWKDADRLHGLATPFGMGGEMAQPWAGNIMQPAAFAADIDPSLVNMEQTLLPQRLLDPHFEETEPVKGVPVEIDNGAAAEWDAHLFENGPQSDCTATSGTATCTPH